MAAKKSKTKKTTSALTTNLFKASNSPLVAFSDDFADDLKAESQAVPVSLGWPFLSTKGGKFTAGPETFDDIDLIVLGFAPVNTYYEGTYDARNPSPPSCWAVGKPGETDLAPPSDLVRKQHETCKGCPQNAFGSAGDGRKGKACKNTVRLVALRYADPSAPGVRLSISPTQVNVWSRYVNELHTLKRPIYSVVTRASITSDSQTQIALSFEAILHFDVKQTRALRDLSKGEAQKHLYQGFEASSAAANKPPEKKIKRRNVKVRSRA